MPAQRPAQLAEIDRGMWQHLGATGLVGTSLVAKLLALGHSVRVLSRDLGKAKRKFPQQGCTCYGPGDWSFGVKGATAVVNLAGLLMSCRKLPLPLPLSHIGKS